MISFKKAVSMYQELLEERRVYEQEWKKVSRYLLPERGVYAQLSAPRKRRLTSAAIVNSAAEDYLGVLTSGIHGALTSPSKPWFRLSWTSERAKQIEELKAWLQQAEVILQRALQASNFYSVIEDGYQELCGFGVNSVFVSENSDTEAGFSFIPLTIGEYLYTLNPKLTVDTFVRVFYLSPQQIYDKYDRVPSEITKIVKNREASQFKVDRVVLEVVEPEKKGSFEYVRQVFLYTTDKSVENSSRVLQTDYFYEMPYMVGRWSIINRDAYAIGPGVKAIPDIKRLQEIEKSALMATHKMVDPPLAIPAHLRGQLKTLPGAQNYTASPTDKITSLYDVRLDIANAGAMAERIEQRIKTKFFNDVFLTAARDPNASPYKATEVVAREQERALRLGPVIEKLQGHFLNPILERCFNILLRQEKFPPLNPELVQFINGYDITIISPLAIAQRQGALQNINSFLAFIGQAAQFDQSVLDKINIDAAVDEYADITGVPYGVLRMTKDVQQIRQQRAQMLQQEKEQQDRLQQAETAGTVDVQRAAATKTQAEAGAILIDGQQKAAETGLI